MKKVIITDDEIQIRKGLRMKVKWETLGLKIVGEASNGLETLHLLEDNKADIIITDVRMPVMDGIELVKECRRKYPDIKIIVLSGYNDFEYARATMREGVQHYLLKPIAPSELKETLQKVCIEIEELKVKKDAENKMLNKVQLQKEEEEEQFFLQLVKEEWHESKMSAETIKQLKLENFLLADGKYQFISVEIRDGKNNPKKARELWQPFRMVCKEMSKEKERTYSFYDPTYKNMIHFIYKINENMLNSQHHLVEDLVHFIKKYMNLEVVVGVGKIVHHYQNFKKGYYTSLLSWSQSELGAQSQIVEKASNKELFKFSQDYEKKLINYMENNKKEQIFQQLEESLGNKQAHSIMSFAFASNRLLYLLGSLAAKYSNHEEIQGDVWNLQHSIWELNAQEKVIERLKELILKIMANIQKEYNTAGVTIVEKVRIYINKHYDEEISLTSLADQFHINSAYLSEVFKIHSGKNFTDYLLHLRMEKAAEYLKDQDLKITDVSQLVGFANSGYFSTVFKKYYGRTPAEFRKSKV